MKRVQLFEFEDFSWFPSIWRSTMTKIIVVLHRLLGTKEVLSNLLLQMHIAYPFDQVVDLGSGSGGAMPMTMNHLNTQLPDLDLKLLLTDLHPNMAFVEDFNQSANDRLQYHPKPVDATDLHKTPAGLKTMVNSFHHMPPQIAKQILASAQENRQAILIYEMAENKIPTVVWALLLPISLPIVAIMAIFFVPFVKPLSWKDLLFTWLIPVIPIFYAWDGQASLPRMYTFKDIQNHLLPEQIEGYTWEMAPAKKQNDKTLGYYIKGLPT